MEKINYPCPCGGTIQWKKDRVLVEKIDCGILDVEQCPKCNEQYFPEETMKIVEQKLREHGLWGIKRKDVTFWQSGSSVLLRIPKDIAEQLSLKPNEKATMYAEGNKKIVVEV